MSVDLGDISHTMLLPFSYTFLQTYERRDCVVHPGWAGAEQVWDRYIQHTLSYRSEKLNRFIKTLDKRAAKKGKSHAQFHHEQGSPRKQPIPHNAKPWMINKKHQAAQENLEVHSVMMLRIVILMVNYSVQVKSLELVLFTDITTVVLCYFPSEW